MKSRNKTIRKDLLFIKEAFIGYTNFHDFDIECKEVDYVYHRFVFMKLCKVLTDAPVSQIGLACGNRDHASIIYGLKRFDVLIEDSFFVSNYYSIYLELLDILEDKFKAIVKTENKSDKAKISFRKKIKELSKTIELKNIEIERERRRNDELISKISKLSGNLKNTDDPIWTKIYKLESDDFKDWKFRSQAFLNMVNSRKRSESKLTKRKIVA